MSQVSNEPQSPLSAAVQAAGLSSVGGFLVGGTLGIAQQKSPITLWILASTVQWSLLGGTFWGVRTALLETQEGYDTPGRRSAISAASGGLSFALVGAITRGRSNIIPGAIVGSGLGFTGQVFSNFLDRQRAHKLANPSSKPPMLDRIMKSDWSPVKKLGDDDYANMLKERLLRVEAEIAILDEEIATLKESSGSDPTN